MNAITATNANASTLQAIVMKPSILFGLTLFFTVVISNNTWAQTCQCDSLIESRRINWAKWVRNSDEIKIVRIVNKGVVNTESKKIELLKQIISDTAWFSYPVSGKIVTVRLGRFDTLAGKQMRIPLEPDSYDSTKGKPLILPGEAGPTRMVSFASKKDTYDAFNKAISLSDEYYEIHFSLGGKSFMSPSFCLKYYCTIMDNVLFNLFIKD